MAVNEEIRSLTKRQAFEKAQQNDEESNRGNLEWQEVQMAATIANQLGEAYKKLETLTVRRDQLLKIIDQKDVAVEEALFFSSNASDRFITRLIAFVIRSQLPI